MILSKHINRVTTSIAPPNQQPTNQMPSDILRPDQPPPDQLSPDQLPPDQPPPSTTPISLENGLQMQLQTRSITFSMLSWSCLNVHLQTRSIMANKCIYKLSLSLPPNASPNLLEHSLQVYFQRHWIAASKCISVFCGPWPPSAFQSTFDHSLHPSASPKSLYHSFQVHL